MLFGCLVEFQGNGFTDFNLVSFAACQLARNSGRGSRLFGGLLCGIGAGICAGSGGTVILTGRIRIFR